MANLARALLRRLNLILADEITASLDAENSAAVRDLLLTLSQTVIEIAHHYEDFSAYDYVLELAKKNRLEKSRKIRKSPSSSHEQNA